MSCIFCDSRSHCPEYCSNYLSDESRRKVLRHKKICESCVSPLIESIQHGSKFCMKKRQCFICFSHDHHSVFCPHRTTNKQIFLPKIDVILFPRFIQILHPLEQYLLAFSARKFFKSMQLKPLTIVSEFGNDQILNPYDTHVILNGTIELSYLWKKEAECQAFFNAISSKLIIVKARILEIQGFNVISADDFLLLLSVCTEQLSVKLTNIIPEIKFSKILEKIPNIKSIEFDEYNSNMAKHTWFEDLSKHINGNQFEKLVWSIPNPNFDIEALVRFMKTKCSHNAKIHFHCQFSTNEFYKLQSKLWDYFYQRYSKAATKGPKLYLQNTNNENGYQASDNYELK